MIRSAASFIQNTVFLFSSWHHLSVWGRISSASCMGWILFSLFNREICVGHCQVRRCTTSSCCVAAPSHPQHCHSSFCTGKHVSVANTTSYHSFSTPESVFLLGTFFFFETAIQDYFLPVDGQLVSTQWQPFLLLLPLTCQFKEGLHEKMHWVFWHRLCRKGN